MISELEKYQIYKKRVRKYILFDIILTPIVTFLANFLPSILKDYILATFFLFFGVVPYLIGLNLTIVHVFLVFRYSTDRKYKKNVKIFGIVELIAAPLLVFLYVVFSDTLSISNIFNAFCFTYWFGFIIPYINMIINTLIHIYLIQTSKKENNTNL